MPSKQATHATVIVLGDLGRSPRMQYHALSLADSGVRVDLIGYAGSPVSNVLREHPGIRCHLITPAPVAFLDRFKERLFPAVSLTRIAIQGLRLLGLLLFVVRKPQVVLIQNPPAVPALTIALVAARLRGARLVIDWHNFGYTLLALKLGPSSRLVRAMRWYEQTLGRRADGHLCVSEAMRRELEDHWKLRDVTVVYDRPADIFTPASAEERSLLHRHLIDLLGENGDGILGAERPALLVSATSWTQDEDFALLLDGLAILERNILEREGSFPALSVVISGEGPLRKFYEARIARMELRRIRIRTVWLAPEDYPLLLRSADLGLCVHRSSSGVDLPMKIADMLGSGLPVLTLNYGPCLKEQLRHGENGLLFSTAAELAEMILELFKDFPVRAPALDRLRTNIAAASAPRWDDEWRARAWPAISQAAGAAKSAGYR